MLNSTTRIEVRCRCGTKFLAKMSDIKRGWGKSCSKSCAAKRSNKETGKYQKYLAAKCDKEQKNELGFYLPHEFSNAHLFSNEE